jgi:DNA mismatch endonuclease, patch repair protein
MSDLFSSNKRSDIMRNIRSTNTKPEIYIRSILHQMGYRFRLHRKDLPGKPDIVLPKYKAVIFVNGCFWHGHKNCKKAKLPQSNRPFWEEKIKSNILRDRKILKIYVISAGHI